MRYLRRRKFFPFHFSLLLSIWQWKENIHTIVCFEWREEILGGNKDYDDEKKIGLFVIMKKIRLIKYFWQFFGDFESFSDLLLGFWSIAFMSAFVEIPLMIFLDLFLQYSREKFHFRRHFWVAIIQLKFDSIIHSSQLKKRLPQPIN